MGRLGEPRTVITEDVGVVMDQQGVGNRVRVSDNKSSLSMGVLLQEVNSDRY